MALVRGLLEGARLRGLAPESLLKDAGVVPDLMNQESARVSTEQYIALFLLLIERLEDETIGLLARPLKRGSLELMAYSALRGPHLAGALKHVCHVMSLLQDDIELTLLTDGELAGVSVRLNPADKRPQFVHELMVRITWRMAAWLAGGSLEALRFDFAFDQPSYALQYGPAFPAPMRFGQRHSAFWFDIRLLERPVLRNQAALRTFVSSWPAALIAPHKTKDGIATRVRVHLQHARPIWPTLTETAAALHVSTATLQRQLATENTSFRELKDDLRRDIAIVQLTISNDSFAEIAAELGFADSPAFQRAFKAWTGSPPGKYRRAVS